MASLDASLCCPTPCAAEPTMFEAPQLVESAEPALLLPGKQVMDSSPCIEALMAANGDSVVVLTAGSLSLKCSKGVAMRASCPVFTSDAPSVPSYMRATAASKKPSTDEEEPKVKTVAPVKKGKYANVASRVTAPTASALARLSGKSVARELPSATERSQALRQSMAAAVLASPIGQRATKAAPFALRSDARSRPAGPALTTEEAADAEARKHQFKPNTVPKALYSEPRPLAGFARAPGTPKRPDEVFEEFKLDSLKRHEAAKAAAQEQVQSAQKAEATAHLFRASPLAKMRAGLAKQHTPAKPDAAPVTRASAPALNANARVSSSTRHATAMAARAAQVAAEVAVHAAEVAAAREEARVSAAFEAMDVAALRASMSAFKGRAMPAFDAPFTPVRDGKATAVAEFTMATDARFGRPVSARDRHDAAAPALGCFEASLRASTVLKAAPKSKTAAI